MSAQPKQQRSEPRMPHRTAVWMQPSNDGASLVGETRDLSTRGMFVKVVPTPPIGQEVLCELPGHEAVRGRVVWVSMPPDIAEHGVGIQFIDLSQTTGPTYAGVELSGPLDFLRAGAEIHVGAASDGRSLRARVAHVELRSDKDAPKLSLSLVLVPQPESVESWFPTIDVDEPANEVEDRRTLAEVLAHDELQPLLVADRRIEQAAPMEIPLFDHTERTLIVPDVAEPAPLRHSKLWPALTLAGVVIGAVVLLRGGPSSQPPAKPQTTPVAHPAPVAVVAAEPVAPPQAQLPPEPEPAPLPTKPIAAAPEPAAEVPAAPIEPALWRPEVSLIAGEPAVIVPIGGTDKGMSHFVLDKPPGIAIDLPHATAATPVKSWLLHNAAFESLWVRVMPTGGLQIRLHLAKGVHVKATVADGQLRIVRREP